MENGWHQYIQRVRYQETDQMGVVHHANYVSWFETGRTEWIRNSGIAYTKLESLGLLLPVVDLSIQFRQSAHYDELIAIFTRLTNFSAVRLQFEYEVRRIVDQSASNGLQDGQRGLTGTPYGELLASGTTLHMWINREWKPARLDKVAPEMYALLQPKKELSGE